MFRSGPSGGGAARPCAAPCRERGPTARPPATSEAWWMRTWMRETATRPPSPNTATFVGVEASLGEEEPGDHGAAGVPAGEAGGERHPQLVRAILLYDRPFTLELALHRPVDHDGLEGEGGGEAQGRPGMVVGPEALGPADEHPDQAEVAQLGEGVEDAVGGLGAPDVVEPAVDHVVEALDRRELVGRLDGVVGEGDRGVVLLEGLERRVDDAFGRQRLGGVGHPSDARGRATALPSVRRLVASVASAASWAARARAWSGSPPKAGQKAW